MKTHLGETSRVVTENEGGRKTSPAFVEGEQFIDGACSCGRRVTKVVDSLIPTCRTDGVRYIYPERGRDWPWCIFRCETCYSVIDESWRPLDLTTAVGESLTGSSNSPEKGSR